MSVTTQTPGVPDLPTPTTVDPSPQLSKHLNSKDPGWWHRASRGECIQAEENMIKSFVDLKRINYNVKDVIIPFDARPERVRNHKSYFSSWFSSSSTILQRPNDNTTTTTNNTNTDTTTNANQETKESKDSDDSNDSNNNQNNSNDSNNDEIDTKDDNDTKNTNDSNDTKAKEKNHDGCKIRRHSHCKRSKTLSHIHTESIHTVSFKLIPNVGTSPLNSGISSAASSGSTSPTVDFLESTDNKDNTNNTDTKDSQDDEEKIEEKERTVDDNDNNDNNNDNNESEVDPDEMMHIVIAHGYGCGLGIFIPAINHIFDNFLESFDENYVCTRVRVHCIDWLGCGLSSKPKFECETTEEAEDFFIDSLEQWRISMNINKMILTGHSIGGYCSSVYSLRYPNNIKQLCLISPAGVAKHPEDLNSLRQRYPWRFRLFFSIVENGFTPADIVRMAGPKAKGMVESLVEKRYKRAPNINNTPYADKLAPLMADYLYQITHGSGSGEYCLNKILTIGAYGQNPLYDRLPGLQKGGIYNIRIDFMYGELDWMDISAAQSLKKDGLNCDVYEIDNSGHQIAIENKELFSKILVKMIREEMERKNET